MMTKFFRYLAGAGAVALAAGCGGVDGGVTFAPYDNSAEVEAYYREHSDFFVFATPEDLPGDLVWEDGMDQPDLGFPEAKKGGTAQFGLEDFPRTLRTVGPDSNGTFRSYLGDWMDMTFARKHPETDEYFPGVAKAWARDKEHHRVFVRIDPEARWTDGEKVTVEDVCFSFYFRRSEYTGDPYGQQIFQTKHTKLVRYDDLTFSLTVAEAKPDYVDWVLQFSPTPRHYYTEFGPDYVERYQWRNEPTTGPYVVKDEDIKKGRSIALTKVDDWWAKDRKFFKYRYNPDRLVFTVIRDPNKMFEAFKKGDVDIMRLNLAEYFYTKLPDDDPLVRDGYIHKATFYNEVPQSGYRLWMNTSKPPLDNLDVRLGICYATNYQLVIDEFFRGDWAREQSGSDGYRDATNLSIRAREFSIPKAREHFAKAGYTKAGPDGILMNEAGERLSFNLSTGNKTMADALSILKQEAAKAGVEFDLEILEATAGWKKGSEKKHEITFAGFSSSASEVYPRYWDFFHSANAYEADGSPKPNTNNLSCFALPELDTLIEKYDRSDDHGEKVALGHRIQEIVHEQAPYVNGVYPPMWRVGYWRWMHWPENFSVKRAEIDREWNLYWVDDAERAATLEAKKKGETFPPAIRVFDRYKPVVSR